MPTYNTVDQYMNDQPQKTQEILSLLMKCITDIVPEAICMINYNIIAFSLTENGKRDQQIMVAGFTHHVGFYPGIETIDEFSEQLAHLKTGKGSVQFPLDKILPCELIKEMVLYTKTRLQILI